MSEWHTFIGRVVPMEWGQNTYTVLPIPGEVLQQLERQGTRRVEIELNDHPFNMALTKAPVISGTFVYAGKSVLQQAQISPGDEIEVRLRHVDPDSVDVPTDVAQAIRESGLSERWASLTAGKQRGLLHQVSTAKSTQTRVRRVKSLLESIAK